MRPPCGPRLASQPPPIDVSAVPALIPFTAETRADPTAVQAARDFVARLNATRNDLPSTAATSTENAPQ